MKANLLRLAEGRVLVEQLRLFIGNLNSSRLNVTLLAMLMFWVLSNENNTTIMGVWCAVEILSTYSIFLYLRRYSTVEISPEQASKIVWVLMCWCCVEGFLWGALIWITFNTSTTAAVFLVITIVAGLLSGSMAGMSPIVPAFFALLVPPVFMVILKILSLNDPIFNALGAGIVLYTINTVGHARNSSRATREAIELRFENIELLEQLRTEKMNADAARREAEQANIAKSKFLAAASHDLRQPIHAQGLFLHVLAHTELNVQQHKLLASICATSNASSEMLNTLLEFSRIEAGVIEPQVEAFCLQSILNKIENEFVRQANDKGLDYRTRTTRLVVQSDPALLEIILRNLVSNAIRYTESGGVLVACRKRGDQVVMEVWDTGMGIPSEHQKEVFQEFHQLGNPERDRRKGLGLGLAIVAGLARLLRHDLSLASSLNHGSVFRLTLPVAAQPETSAVIELDRVRLLNVRVLVVDDDEAVRMGMLHLLLGWGCECDVADSIEEAITVTRTHAPDLIICDYRLREQRNGQEAITILRALLGETLPALLISGDTAPDRLREAQASGIPLLHKPVSPILLYRKMVSILLQK